MKFLFNSYNIYSNVPLGRLSPYVKDIIGEYQCGFMTHFIKIDHIFSIRKILKRNKMRIRNICYLVAPFKTGNTCYYSVQILLSCRLLSKNLKTKIYKKIVLPVVLYGCETWSLTLREESRIRVF